MGEEEGERESTGERREVATLHVYKIDAQIQNAFLTCLQRSFAANWNPRIGMFLPKMQKASHEEC